MVQKLSLFLKEILKSKKQLYDNERKFSRSFKRSCTNK